MAHDPIEYPPGEACRTGPRAGVLMQTVLPELGRRALTTDERMLWSTCPVCQAKHGEACSGLIGIPLGGNVRGERPTEGAHLARLQRAPRAIRVIEEF